MADTDVERMEAERLFQLLDDIDTLRDIYKGIHPDGGDGTNYEAIARAALRISDKRWNGPITTDGYTFIWKGEEADRD